MSSLRPLLTVQSHQRHDPHDYRRRAPQSNQNNIARQQYVRCDFADGLRSG